MANDPRMGIEALIGIVAIAAVLAVIVSRMKRGDRPTTRIPVRSASPGIVLKEDGRAKAARAARRRRARTALADPRLDRLELRRGDHAVGRNPLELDVRSRTGAIVVAVRRGRVVRNALDPLEPFMVGDEVFLIGSTNAIDDATSLLMVGRTRRASYIG